MGGNEPGRRGGNHRGRNSGGRTLGVFCGRRKLSTCGTSGDFLRRGRLSSRGSDIIGAFALRHQGKALSGLVRILRGAFREFLLFILDAPEFRLLCTAADLLQQLTAFFVCGFLVFVRAHGTGVSGNGPTGSIENISKTRSNVNEGFRPWPGIAFLQIRTRRGDLVPQSWAEGKEGLQDTPPDDRVS